MTLEQLTNFLKDIRDGIYLRESLINVEIALSRALTMNVYVTSLDEIYTIPNAGVMRALILSGTNPFIKGSYHPVYRRWKELHGLPPHQKTGRMKAGTSIVTMPDRVLFFIPTSATTATYITKAGRVHVYNFGPIHEQRKSVLKATVAFAWKDIMNRIRNIYLDGTLKNGGIIK